MSWYILIDRELCALYIDAVHFLQILLFCLFSAYYYIMSLNDFRPIFLNEFKLNQSAAEIARKFNQAFGNEHTFAHEHTVRRWFTKIRSGHFSLEDESRNGGPTYSKPRRGFEDPGGD